ncbi:multifunctional cyclase-dehydratase-3-O-methyl transferase TcmN [mine drainage metagenome]|uniref:Multifunctional cyclase-dehydratase-3-O-methyl transferase TcmN n=1 Tax=mine drainage metagenome TaxID=410659 RepID=A0A1J5R7T3_9ZZZZ
MAVKGPASPSEGKPPAHFRAKKPPRNPVAEIPAAMNSKPKRSQPLVGFEDSHSVLPMNTPTPSPDRIMQTGMAFWASKVLLSAVELEVFTDLARKPADGDTLRGRLGLHERGARDFLDALVSMGFLERENGVYRNTPETDLFLDKRKPTYLGGILEMANHRLFPSWAHLTEALRTGEPQSETKHEADTFGALYADPARLREFLRAMSSVSRRANQAIAANFPWKDYKTFVDLGTAQGDLPAQIALKNPHLAGIGFDLPQVEPVFEEYIRSLGLADRLRFAGGDFFADPLPSADVVLLGHILHDWDLPRKRALLVKAHAALPTGGAVIAYDALIDDDRRERTHGLLMSLNMLVETPGGFDYTGAECQRWMRDAGFRETRVEHLLGPDYVVIGIK